jgi:hypothetical protein
MLGQFALGYNSRMATTIYDSKTITLIDGTEINASPLKIKYLREFMTAFESVKTATNDDESIDKLVECLRIAMKQYCPTLITKEEVEDAVDIKTMYALIDVAAGISFKEDDKSSVKEQAEGSGMTWDEVDLAKLESEVFLLGIWKDYEELETSLSMPELMSTLSSKRESEYQDKKFFAAMQGIDLDEQSGKKNAWEELKARVYSGGKARDSNDILALQGVNAQKAGFGIGMGLGYEDLTKK